jgi:hypothetical protein
MECQAVNGRMPPHPLKSSVASPSFRGIVATEGLLISGGDARLALDPATGANRYGCPPRPMPAVLDFASATASIVSPLGFSAADTLRRKIAFNPVEQRRTIARIREEIPELLGLGDIAGLTTLLAPSGTDLHALAVGSQAKAGLTVLMAAPAETGSGVPAALAGPPLRLAHPQRKGVELHSIALRQADGRPRAAGDVDRGFALAARQALDEGREVLLVVLDVSKTGLTAPSPAMVLRLMENPRLRVLVDACQTRLAPTTMAGWLRSGAMLALTGSKFLGGPSFSGALLVPAGMDNPVFHCPYALPQPGLILRWEAALAELRAFRAVPDAGVSAILREFGAFLAERLAGGKLIEPLPGLPVDRGAMKITPAWDALPSIFSLRFRAPSGAALGFDAVAKLHRQLRQDLSQVLKAPAAASIVHLGQPVACGSAEGQPTAALRLCLSARQLVEAVEAGSAETLIRQADIILEKIALILRLRPDLA